jgi:hypothetical protein
VESLDLKIVAHRGRFLRHAVGGRAQVAGADVILTHRLLKNAVTEQQRAYLLLTEALRRVAAARRPPRALRRPRRVVRAPGRGVAASSAASRTPRRRRRGGVIARLHRRCSVVDGMTTNGDRNDFVGRT